MNNRIWLTIIALAGLATCAIPSGAQNQPMPNSVTGSLSTTGTTLQSNPIGSSGTCQADVSGTWTGTLTFQVNGQSNNPQSAVAYNYQGVKQGTTTTANGMFYWPSMGALYCSVAATSIGSGTAVVTITPTNGTAALAPGVISSIGPVTLVTPVTVNCGATPCSVTTPAPATTVSPGLMVGVTDVCPSTAPAAINGAYTCSITSSGNLNVVQNAAPSATTPVSTPSAAALPTASAGVAPPAQAPQVSDFPACEYSGLLAVLSGQNFVTIQCDVTGRIFVNSDDPSQTFNSAALASATTTVLKTGIATKQIYVYLAAWESTGTNSGNTIQWEYSTNATCSSGNTSILPAAIAPGTAAGEWTSMWGIQAVSNTTVGGMPGANGKALVLPAGNTLCGVTAGTTTAGSFVTVLGIH